MRLPEQRLWDTMRNHKPPGFVLERVENVVGDGMPDVYVMAPAVSTWVELKAPNPRKRKSTRILGDEGLRQSQKNWHVRASRLGLFTYVLIRERCTRRLWLLSGEHADDMNEMTAYDLTIHCCRLDITPLGTLTANTWPTVFKVLER